MPDADADRPWRCFVAVPISAELREALADYVAGLRRSSGPADGWRWTDAGGWHVTLAFLGATLPAAVSGLAAALARTAASATPFGVSAGGLGAFPSPKRARVLWYGIDDSERRLGGLAGAVQGAMGLLHEQEASFRGHVTLARARDRSGTDATALLAGAAPPAGEVRVDRLILYRSHLGRGPARHEELAVAVLGGAAA